MSMRNMEEGARKRDVVENNTRNVWETVQRKRTSGTCTRILEYKPSKAYIRARYLLFELEQ